MSVRDLVLERITFNPHKMGQKAEKLQATRLRAKQHKASGSMPDQRGDMSRTQFVLESKATSGSTFRLSRSDLEKIRQIARRTGKVPALSIGFTTGDGRPVEKGVWICIPEEVFDTLVGDK